MAHDQHETAIGFNVARYFVEHRHISWVLFVGVLVWGVGAYQARSSDAIRPNAAAKMKRRLERKPMVRMGRWLLIGSANRRLNTPMDGNGRIRVQTRVWHSLVKSAKERLTSAFCFIE